MSETMTSDAMLARLEALTARLEDQAAQLQGQAAEISDLRAENARLAGIASASARAGPRSARRAGLRRIGRRGLVAGLAGLVGAGLTKLGRPDRVEAADGAFVQVGHVVGSDNPSDVSTGILSFVPNLPGMLVSNGISGTPPAADATPDGIQGLASDAVAAGLRGLNVNGDGVVGRTAGISAGVRGLVAGPVSNTGTGVVGLAAGCEISNGLNVGVAGSGRNATSTGGAKIGVLGVTYSAVGVQGQAQAGGVGVRGSSNAGGGEDFGGSGIGVEGRSGTGTGVRGQSTSSIGVHGKSTNNAGVFAEGPIGVYAAGTGVAGVFGGSSGGFGFWGNSATSAGIYGTSTTGPGVRAESTNQYGLHAKGPTYAGVFEGNVFVTGRVVALGGVGASATTTTTTRTLVEDVGEATLTNGKATVALAEDFATAANGDYRVFLTELADLGGLYVARKGPREFEVRSRGGTGQVAQSGRFDYRVVAKTAGANNPRQAPLAPPDLTTIKPAPPLPEPPKAPEPSGASPERRER